MSVLIIAVGMKNSRMGNQQILQLFQVDANGFVAGSIRIFLQSRVDRTLRIR